MNALSVLLNEHRERKLAEDMNMPRRLHTKVLDSEHSLIQKQTQLSAIQL
jgi:hypothetical protein